MLFKHMKKFAFENPEMLKWLYRCISRHNWKCLQHKDMVLQANRCCQPHQTSHHAPLQGAATWQIKYHDPKPMPFYPESL